MTEAVVDDIKKRSKEIETKDEIARVAAISARTPRGRSG